MTEIVRSQNRLHVENLYKRYGAKTILDNVDISVRPGELVSVVGPSGCGKSTLLRMIIGQEIPSEGTIMIDGKLVGPPNPERGVVYQRYSLFPHLTALENVMLGPKVSMPLIRWWRARETVRSEASSFLREVGLADHSAKYPHELSGGQQQRVAVAQALIQKPKILLMDEPFGALDPGTREDLQLFLMELWEQYEMTIFFVTHDLEEAVYLGTRLIVLSRYYSDDRAIYDSDAHGAKVVADFYLRDRSAGIPTREKYTAQFNELLLTVRQAGFDPEYRQHVKAFDLKHQDSFRSAAVGEE